jgi:glycosyltransferase involved in cell wall biosynthesis
MAAPKISIVIPAHNASRTLVACLSAVAESGVKPFELLVVDDGSTDETPGIAARCGARVLETGGKKGPSHARNLGAREAKGDVLFFIDADVCIRPDSLSRLSATFAGDSSIDAVIGSYDDTPQEQDVLSMYRNLMHRYVHQNSKREASTFWSGCGAIRRSVFLEFNGFDEGYGRPAIEDIELGYRLTSNGRKIILDHELEVKHLKRWTFINLIKTDVFDRAIPWTELILRDGRMPNDLNVQTSQRLSVGLAFLLFGFALAGALYYRGLFVVPLLASMLFALACYWTEAGSLRGTGVKVVFSGLVLAFVGMAYWQHMISLIPPVLVGYFLLFIRYRYTSQNDFMRRITGTAYAAYLVGSLIFIARFLPARVPVICFYAMILMILVINRRFYSFLAHHMGWLTALAAIPFHVLFYFYSGLSFLTGVLMCGWRGLTSAGRNKAVNRAES